MNRSKPSNLPLRVAKASASDANAAMDILFSLFADHYPVQIDEDEHAWFFRLDWPSESSWYVDPELTSQSEKLWNCSIGDLGTLFKDRSNNGIAFVFSMFHSRALLAPALAQQFKPTHFSDIVHVDDHDDMMMPLLNLQAKDLFDPISGVVVDLNNTSSISSAIDRGVIHKGSFMAAYVLGHSPGTLIHVSDRLHDQSFWLQPQQIGQYLGDRTLPISTIAFTPMADSSKWKYLETSTFPLNLKDVEAVWLDVDLDEFCNRFDGDSSRSALQGDSRERLIMENRIERFLEGLNAASWKTQVRAVSVAASPAFFPSEYWDFAIPRICEGIISSLNIK